jgi:hypothetical protein
MQPIDEVQGKRVVCLCSVIQTTFAESFFARAAFGTELQVPSRACLFGHSPEKWYPHGQKRNLQVK